MAFRMLKYLVMFSSRCAFIAHLQNEDILVVPCGPAGGYPVFPFTRSGYQLNAVDFLQLWISVFFIRLQKQGSKNFNLKEIEI